MKTLNPIEWVEDKWKMISFIRYQRSIHKIPATKCIDAWFVRHRDIICDDYELEIFCNQVKRMANTNLVII